MDGGGAVTTKRFLVVYDYGQGGVWAFVNASSRAAIERRYPELKVVDLPPDWLSESDLARLRARTLDLDRPSGLLTDLVSQRKGSSTGTG